MRVSASQLSLAKHSLRMESLPYRPSLCIVMLLAFLRDESSGLSSTSHWGCCFVAIQSRQSLKVCLQLYPGALPIARAVDGPQPSLVYTAPGRLLVSSDSITPEIIKIESPLTTALARKVQPVLADAHATLGGGT